MSKITIVGVEGSGKTVLMTALGNKYERPDEHGIFLSPENSIAFDFVQVQMKQMRQGQWPAATMTDSLRNLQWGVFCGAGGTNKKICDLSFLDFAGEIYRRAFGDYSSEEKAAYQTEIDALRNHIRESDMLVVLINLGDIINGSVSNARTREMMWLSKGILDFAFRETKIRKIAIAFSQADSYRTAIERCGGLAETYRFYLPHVASLYDDVSLLAVSAISKTVPDENGFAIPAHGFSSEGIDELMEWIISNIAGYESLAKNMKERRAQPDILMDRARKAQSLYLQKCSSGMHSAGRRLLAEAFSRSVHDLRNHCERYPHKLNREEYDNICSYASIIMEFEARVSRIVASVQADIPDEALKALQELWLRYSQFKRLEAVIVSEVYQEQSRLQHEIAARKAALRRRRMATYVVCGLAVCACVPIVYQWVMEYRNNKLNEWDSQGYTLVDGGVFRHAVWVLGKEHTSIAGIETAAAEHYWRLAGEAYRWKVYSAGNSARKEHLETEPNPGYQVRTLSAAISEQEKREDWSAVMSSCDKVLEYDRLNSQAILKKMLADGKMKADGEERR